MPIVYELPVRLVPVFCFLASQFFDPKHMLVFVIYGMPMPSMLKMAMMSMEWGKLIKCFHVRCDWTLPGVYYFVCVTRSSPNRGPSPCISQGNYQQRPDRSTFVASISTRIPRISTVLSVTALSSTRFSRRSLAGSTSCYMLPLR